MWKTQLRDTAGKAFQNQERLFQCANESLPEIERTLTLRAHATRRMGVKWKNGEHNPLRPKRMRHLFRTACDTAGITELYTNAFMGHTNHQGQDYSELSKAKLELEYLRVESFLTVYGKVEESLEIKQDVRKLESRIVDLNRKEQLKTSATSWKVRLKKSLVSSLRDTCVSCIKRNVKPSNNCGKTVKTSLNGKKKKQEFPKNPLRLRQRKSRLFLN